MVVAPLHLRVPLPWGVLTEPQGRAGRSGSLWGALSVCGLISASSCKTLRDPSIRARSER
jgi:hypothetical protein